MRGFSQVWLIVGALIIIIASGAYYLGKSTTPKPSSNPVVTSQTPQPTPSSTPGETVYTESDRSANWKTYTGSKYSFKYPDTWTNDVSDQKYSESGIIIYTNDSEYTDFSNIQKGAFIYIFFGSETIPLGSFTLEDIASKDISIDKNKTLISKNNIVLQGQKATEIISMLKNGESARVLFTYPDGRNYAYLELISSVSEFSKNIAIFHQMLSTFKFNQ